ncbi:coiled-coil domain-protein 8 [Dichotomopilus funicola]|uniref:Coiled-coil domain-protein 8 n=1 Tax=Dichotomopilus funicola TaxID=1934379 RepID=A0AAN6UV04_9PEZI|nr:coiled-coil domain-protein 8 [Dichotomopilus funicola]
MKYPCSLNVHISVETVTLIGLTFLTVLSFLYHSMIMARKRRSGTPKPQGTQSAPGTPVPQSAGPTATPTATTSSKAVTTPRGPEAKDQAKAAASAPTVRVDGRPENSPYGSPSCTVPFASPLTVPLDILKKSPKLYAAYEAGQPELSTIPHDVGHVLVHFLHTGHYESLKPKLGDARSRQIAELRTAVQTYAAARAYELPGLMRLAEGKIDRFSKGLPLPVLLEVARDAYPTLTEGDAWFLNYLRSRIRPHLKDPKALIGSSLLDQISDILSPHRVLLRTVLELFCERSASSPEGGASFPMSALASPVTSPATSRPVTPLPSTSPLSLLEMRSRSIVREDYTSRKSSRSTPQASPEPVHSEIAPPTFEAKPVPEPAPAVAPFPDLGPVIADLAPARGLSTSAGIAVADIASEHVPEPEAKDVAEPVNAGVESEDEADAGAQVDEYIRPSVEVPVGVHAETPAELEVVTGAEPAFELGEEEDEEEDDDEEDDGEEEEEEEEKGKQEAAVADSTPAALRERKDSGKGIELEPNAKEVESAFEPATELETGSKPQLPVRLPVFREADSGFWEGADVESAKETAPSFVELEPVPEPTSEAVHEVRSTAGPKEVRGTDTRDFADSDAEGKTGREDEAEEEVPANETALEALPTAESSTASAGAHSELKNPPVPAVDGAAKDLVDIAPIQKEVAEVVAQSKEDEAQPEPEKIQTELLELETGAKPEPEPEAESSKAVRPVDDAEPTGGADSSEAEPGVESGSQPAGKLTIQRANTDSAVHAAGRAAKAVTPEALLDAERGAEQQEEARVDAGADGLQPCSAQVRHKSWKKRFLSLRYPVLFGRGM